MTEGKGSKQHHHQQHHHQHHHHQHRHQHQHHQHQQKQQVQKMPRIRIRYKWIAISLSIIIIPLSIVLIVDTTLMNNNTLKHYTNEIKLLFQMEDSMDINKTKMGDVHYHYQILDSKELFQRLIQLTKKHSKFVSLMNAQEEFDLPAAGTELDCPFDIWSSTSRKKKKKKNSSNNNNSSNNSSGGGGGCRNWILTIEDKLAHPPNSSSWKLLPEVFLSGALHGNERVGPTVVVEAAQLLLEAASCQLSSSSSSNNNNNNNNNDCRVDLYKKFGMTDQHRQWLAHLVSTRRIVIIPTANALGYYRNIRNEGGDDINDDQLDLDPNRDFPFDLDDYPSSPNCMKTIAARTINEVFQRHMFQLGITFHGGMESIAYEWGAPSFYDDDGLKSPDDISQQIIAEGFSKEAGFFGQTKEYITGTMNDVVYYVQGGMEDWAYAGSTFSSKVPMCNPNSDQYKPYSPNRTIYNNSTLRMFNILIETSDAMVPSNETLGTTESLFSSSLSSNFERNKANGSHVGNGHISRNIRITLMMIDIVQPYVLMMGLDAAHDNNGMIPIDIAPPPAAGSKKQPKHIYHVPSDSQLTLQWTVGGGFEIEHTTLVYTPCSSTDELFLQEDNNNENENGVFIDDSMLDGSNPKSPFHFIGESFVGRTRWHKKGSKPSSSSTTTTKTSSTSSSSSSSLLGPIFSTTINTSSLLLSSSSSSLSSKDTNDKVCIMAIAKLDAKWSNLPKSGKVSPKQKHKQKQYLGPISHLANVRTNSYWFHQSAGKQIQGKIWWHSYPIIITNL